MLRPRILGASVRRPAAWLSVRRMASFSISASGTSPTREELVGVTEYGPSRKCERRGSAPSLTLPAQTSNLVSDGIAGVASAFGSDVSNLGSGIEQLRQLFRREPGFLGSYFAQGPVLAIGSLHDSAGLIVA